MSKHDATVSALYATPNSGLWDYLAKLTLQELKSLSRKNLCRCYYLVMGCPPPANLSEYGMAQDIHRNL